MAMKPDAQSGIKDLAGDLHYDSIGYLGLYGPFRPFSISKPSYKI